MGAWLTPRRPPSLVSNSGISDVWGSAPSAAQYIRLLVRSSECRAPTHGMRHEHAFRWEFA